MLDAFGTEGWIAGDVELDVAGHDLMSSGANGRDHEDLLMSLGLGRALDLDNGLS